MLARPRYGLRRKTISRSRLTNSCTPYMQLNISEDFGRLSADMELTVFRPVQECLTNNHRHSVSKAAAINIVRGPASVSGPEKKRYWTSSVRRIGSPTAELASSRVTAFPHLRILGTVFCFRKTNISRIASQCLF